MLGDITKAEKIYIACGHTDLRMGIDGLAQLVERQFKLNPFSSSVYLFCGRRRNRIKVLLWEGDGFVLLYKRLESGVFQWPRNEQEVRELSWQQLRWLLVSQRSVGRPAQGSQAPGTSGSVEAATAPCRAESFQQKRGLFLQQLHQNICR